MNGLKNYWPIRNDLYDWPGSMNMYPGPSMAAGGSVSLSQDKFGNINGSIFLNNGYYQVPSGIYFDGSFSILAWVKLNSKVSGMKLIDFSNGNGVNTVAIQLIDPVNKTVPSFISNTNMGNTAVTTSFTFNMSQWYHVAGVMDGLNAYLYVDGSLVGSTTGPALVPAVNRTQCYFGRSSYYPGDKDANAYFDEIKIYNRALSLTDIQNDINMFS